MRIRAAELADLPELERQALSALELSNAPAGTEEGRRLVIAHVLRNHLVVLAEEISSAGARYRGSLALERMRWRHAPGADRLQDVWWHALDAKAALALHRAARQVASRLGVPLWQGETAGAQRPATARLLRRLGGELVGTVWRFGP